MAVVRCEAPGRRPKMRSSHLCLIMFLVLLGCRSATLPQTQLGATEHYGRIFRELFDNDLQQNYGISYRQSIGGRVDMHTPEVLIMVFRKPLNSPFELGPVTARFVYPDGGRPLLDQLAALPSGSSYGDARAAIKVTRRELNEENCPAVRDLWSAAASISYLPGEWSFIQPHSLPVEVTVRNASNKLTLDCLAGCGGFSAWASTAFEKMKLCTGN